MTDAVATVRDRLLSIGAVTALASTRVYSETLPQTPVFPLVLVERVDAVERSHFRGGNDLIMTRVQVTSVALSRAAAVALDAAVQGDGATTGLTNWSGTVGSPSVLVRWMEPAIVVEGYDPADRRQYRINRDYKVHHQR